MKPETSEARLLPLGRVAARLNLSPSALREAMEAERLVALYVNDVQQMGEIGNLCTRDRTGETCPYCQCERGPAHAA